MYDVSKKDAPDTINLCETGLEKREDVYFDDVNDLPGTFCSTPLNLTKRGGNKKICRT